MLYNIVLLPQSLPNNPDNLEWYLLKLILDQVKINGVLIVDRDSSLLFQLKSRIKRDAPDNLCDELVKRLEELEKAELGRVWPVAEWVLEKGDKLAENFKKVGTTIYYKININKLPLPLHLVVTGQNFGVAVGGRARIFSMAPSGGEEIDSSHKSNVTISTVASSDILTEMSINSYIFGEYQDESIIRRVFEPVFAQSDFVDIYDRLIGSSFKSTENYAEIQENYKTGLNKLLNLYCIYTYKTDLHFHIYTKIDDKINPESITNLIVDLQQNGEMYLQNREDRQKRTLSVKLFQSLDYSHKMRHNRYMGTSQIVISIDKGADVLQEKSIFSSDYAIVTPRSQFNKYTKGWSPLLSVNGDGRLQYYRSRAS